MARKLHQQEKKDKIMEFINSIELQGIVGVCTITEVGPNKVARFAVCTERSYKSQDGTPVIESTWHNCTAWSGDCKDVEKLERGKMVNVRGSVRRFKYTMNDGSEHAGSEVLVDSLRIINTN